MQVSSHSLRTSFAAKSSLCSVRGRDESRPYFVTLVLHCYPKTNTNMFVITCSLRKCSGDRRVSDSDIPPAKAQRRQVRNRCHFDPWEKSFLDSSCPLGMTGIARHLCAFARDNPSFGCGCSPTGEPLFPSVVWGKACTTIAANLRGSRKFFPGNCVAANNRIGRATTGGCPYNSDSSLRTLRLNIRIRIFYFVSLVPFVVNLLLLFGCGCAALGSLWLNPYPLRLRLRRAGVLWRHGGLLDRDGTLLVDHLHKGQLPGPIGAMEDKNLWRK